VLAPARAAHPGLTLPDADWLAQTALSVAAEKSLPPLAVAVIEVV
jgi:hypothetical protein